MSIADCAAPAGQRGAPEVAPDRLHVGRLPADDARRHGLGDAGADGALQRQGQQMQVAHAGDAGGGDDLHHHQVPRGAQRMAE
jgi:hypothetical protein